MIIKFYLRKETNNNEGLFTLINRLSISKKDYTITIEDQEKEEDRSMNWFSNRANNTSSPNKVKTLPPNIKTTNNKVFNAVDIKRTTSSDKLPPPEHKENPFLPSLRRQTSTPLLSTKEIKQEDELGGPISLENIEAEKVNFKSFKIIKVLGSGAFGKVFMV